MLVGIRADSLADPSTAGLWPGSDAGFAQLQASNCQAERAVQQPLISCAGQVDEPALREGLPLKSERWQSYLTWAVDAFKLATTVAQPSTQIVTHLCYSEFADILEVPACTALLPVLGRPPVLSWLHQ